MGTSSTTESDWTRWRSARPDSLGKILAQNQALRRDPARPGTDVMADPRFESAATHL